MLTLPIPSSLGLIPLNFDLLWSYVIVSNRTKHVKDRCNALLVSGFTLLCVRSWFGCLSLSAVHPTKNLVAYLNPQPSILNTQHGSSHPTTPIFLSAMHRVRSARRKFPPIGLVLSMIVVMSVGTKDRSTNLLMEYGDHSPILRPYTRITNSIIPGIDSIDFRSTLVLRHRFESNESLGGAMHFWLVGGWRFWFHSGIGC
jgi:hypothetical protein